MPSKRFAFSSPEEALRAISWRRFILIIGGDLSAGARHATTIETVLESLTSFMRSDYEHLLLDRCFAADSEAVLSLELTRSPDGGSDTSKINAWMDSPISDLIVEAAVTNSI